MSKKRYNIWLDTVLIDEIKLAASTLGVKVSTYMRMAILEKLRRDISANGKASHRRIVDKSNKALQSLQS